MSDAPVFRPHSPRQNGWALAALALLAVGSFSKGVIDKSGFGGRPPSSAIAETTVQATPAAPQPALQLAAAQPRPQRAPKVEPQPVGETPSPDVSTPAQQVEAAEPPAPAPAAVDASAIAPEPEALAEPPV